MLSKIREIEINTELIVIFVFILISGAYILIEYGTERLLDALFLWMFPASIMVFLTLLLVKIIEGLHEKKVRGYKYVDWRKN